MRSAVAVAWVAAIVTAVVWSAKAVAIGVAGGLDRSPLEGPLVLLGFGTSLVAVAALGVALTASRPVALRVAAAVGAMVAWFVLLLALDAAVSAVEPSDPGWAWEEISLWVAAALLLGAAGAVRSGAARRADVAVA